MFVCVFVHKYAEGPVNVHMAEGRHGLPVHGLSVKSTVNIGPHYPDRPCYDKSKLRKEKGSQGRIWLQIKWDKPYRTHYTFTQMCSCSLVCEQLQPSA